MPCLKLDIDDGLLRRAYHAMAKVLLERSRCRFAKVGALVQEGCSGPWEIRKHAITFNMNELVGLANFPQRMLSAQGTYETANEYFLSLAEDYLCNLKMQQYNAVIDENDCRKKYIARCLFRKIAGQFSTTYNRGPFILFCEDLRPSNLFIDSDFNTLGVVDWEFCYAVPVEFALFSPWWLLLARPETWEAGFDDFLHHYIPRQTLFLGILRDCEEELIKKGAVLESPRPSDVMVQSLDNGTFWFVLAATYAWTLDDVYWKLIHPKHYRESESIEDLIELLSSEERDSIDDFVKNKMQKANKGELVQYENMATLPTA